MSRVVVDKVHCPKHWNLPVFCYLQLVIHDTTFNNEKEKKTWKMCRHGAFLSPFFPLA